jgi:hypothetical protein
MDSRQLSRIRDLFAARFRAQGARLMVILHELGS